MRMKRRLSKTLCVTLFILVLSQLITNCIDLSNIWKSDYVHPTAKVKDATNITENSATLNGEVQPNSENLRISFLLSTNNNFVQAINLQADPNYFPSSTKWFSTSSLATNLESNTIYYFTNLIENDHSLFGSGSFKTL